MFAQLADAGGCWQSGDVAQQSAGHSFNLGLVEHARAVSYTLRPGAERALGAQGLGVGLLPE